MANIFMRFPGGKAKALTLSYDDGVEQDIRLIEIMKKHGLKGTFNLNSGLYAPEGKVYPEGAIHRRMSKSMALELYKDSGMEVAVHGLTHPFLEQLPTNLCTYEIMQDRINLEEDYGTIVRGMAYPFGTYSDDVVASMKQSGIVYSRTVVSTEKFSIPTDWLRLPATCHHNNPRLMELAQQFVENAGKSNRGPALFYLWGHSYEFDSDDNWNVIEEFAEYIGGREDIWYATNIEIYDYIDAYNRLIFSMDWTKVYNPTATELYFETRQGIYCVKPGETVNYK
ncbi:MAG: polysaccharide deacetylase family protein [Lachnospiraceae bacterium]|nr:polysaccharide deacetylase family protein [Lachnospiraceae bacterium]